MRMREEVSVEELYKLYADDIYEFALYSLGNLHDARDVVQEVFLRCLGSIQQFRNESSIKTWLLRIARNYIYDLYRRKDLEKKHRGTNTLSEDIPFELTFAIRDSIMKLKPSQRQVIVLRFIHDLPANSVAKILGCSPANVRVTQHRALRQLESILKEDETVGFESSY
jgi:RNA polymerase sigma-70 factor, ECF subfamily